MITEWKSIQAKIVTAGFILAAGCMPNVATAADITQIQEVTEPMIHMTQISPYSWYGESFSISYGKKQTATKYFDGTVQ